MVHVRYNTRFQRALRRSLRTVLRVALTFVVLISQFAPYTYNGASSVPAAEASNQIPKILNYQARVTDEDGVPVPNGNLNIWIKVYDAASAGTCLYAMRGSCGTPSYKTVTVTNGVFSMLVGDVNGGDVEIPESLFDSNTLFLGVTVASDTEMVPRKRITAAPYALNSDKLDDLDATSSGSTTPYIVATTTNGNLTITGDPQGTGIGNGSLYVNPAAATADETIFGAASNGSTLFRIDKEGDITHTGSLLATAASSTAQFVFRGAAAAAYNIFEVQDSFTSRLLMVSSTSTLIAPDAFGYKVGIGTLAPTNKLSVWADVGVSDVVQFSSAAGSGNIITKFTNGTGGIDVLRIGVSASTGESWMNSYAGIHFGTNSSTFGANERVTITAAGLFGINNTAPANVFTIGSTSTFEVDVNGNLVKIRNVPYSWPASQGAATTVLQNNGSGTLTWVTSGSTVNLQQAYNNATSSTELSISGRNALTIADTLSGTGNIFEIQNLTNPDTGDYSARYFTVSSTAVSITPLPIGTGTLQVIASSSVIATTTSGLTATPRGQALAVIANTTSPDIHAFSVHSNVGTDNSMKFAVMTNGKVMIGGSSYTPTATLTVRDSIAEPTHNLFEISNSLNTAAYFTISSTATVIGNASSTYIIDTTKSRITGNLTPSTDNTYSLGDPALRWKDLWLSGGSANIAYDTSGTSILKLGFETTHGYRGVIATPTGTPFQLRSGLGSTDSAGLYISGSNLIGISTVTPAYPLDIRSGSGLAVGGTSGYQGTFTNAMSSPFAISTLTGLGGTGSWRGELAFNVSYNAGAAFSAMTIKANTDGTTAVIDLISPVTATTITSSVAINSTAGGAYGAGTQALASNLYVQSRLENLITNGNGLLGNNYNFTSFTFSQTEVHGGTGSFLKNVSQGLATNDEYIPVDPEKYYRLIAWGKSGEVGGTNFNAANRQYLGIIPYDIDNNQVTPEYYSKYSGSTDTTLAADLNPSDTTMTLTDATGWSTNAAVYTRNFVWYGYTNTKGYTYPNYTYSRNWSGNYSSNSSLGTWDTTGISGNVITLRVAWAGPAIPAGTAIRNNTSGGTYKYIGASNVIVPNYWMRYEGYIGTLDTTGAQSVNQFPYGTSSIRLLFLINYHAAADNNIRWSDLVFTETSSKNLEAASSTAPGVVSLSNQSLGAGDKYFSGSVGIGTTAPNALLDVSSAAAPAIYISNTTNSSSWTPDTTVGQLGFYSADASGGGAGVRSAVQMFTENAAGNLYGLRFMVDAGSLAEKMRITSAGNVGIGATVPAAKLEVSTASAVDGLRMSFSSDVRYYHSIYNSFSATPSSSSLSLKVNNGTADTQIELLKLRGDGQITIGSASTTSTIVPNARFAGNLTPSADATYTLGDPALRWKDLWLSGGSANIAYDTSGTSILRLGFETTLGYRGVIATPSGTPLQLRSGLASSDTAGVYINTSNQVGIGTASPSAQLQIGTHFQTVPAATGIAVNGTYSIRFLGTNGNADYGGYAQLNSYANGSNMTFGTRDATVDKPTMTLKNSKVGIMTTDPGAELDLRDSSPTPTDNIFQVANFNDSTRYLTVSSTGTILTDLTITGTCTGCSGGSTNLNQAYLASTNSAEISLSPSIGALTVADTYSGTGNIFEIQNRTNNTDGTYSTRYFTVSSTSTIVNQDLNVNGRLTIGDSSADTVTSNFGQWNFANNVLASMSTYSWTYQTDVSAGAAVSIIANSLNTADAFAISSSATRHANSALLSLADTGAADSDSTIFNITSSNASAVSKAIDIDLDNGNTNNVVFTITSDETTLSGTSADTAKFEITSAGSLMAKGDINLGGTVELNQQGGDTTIYGSLTIGDDGPDTLTTYFDSWSMESSITATMDSTSHFTLASGLASPTTNLFEIQNTSGGGGYTQQYLTVSSTSTHFTVPVFIDSGSNNNPLDLKSTQSSAIISIGASGGTFGYIGVGDNADILTSAHPNSLQILGTNYVHIGSNDTTAMSITADGYYASVGIGTINPSAQLTISSPDVAPTYNLFEIQNTSGSHNQDGTYTKQYLTVSSTTTAINEQYLVFTSNNTTTGAAFTVQADSLSTGTAARIRSSAARSSGALLELSDTGATTDPVYLLNITSTNASANADTFVRILAQQGNTERSILYIATEETTISGASLDAFSISSSGSVNMAGNLVVGNASSTNTVDFRARLASNLTPTTDATYTLGDPALRWKDLWLSGGSANIAHDTSGTSVMKVGIETTTGLRGVIAAPSTMGLQLKTTRGSSDTNGIYINTNGQVGMGTVRQNSTLGLVSTSAVNQTIAATNTSMTTNNLFNLVGGDAITTGSMINVATATYAIGGGPAKLFNINFAHAANSGSGGTVNGIHITSRFNTFNTAAASGASINAIWIDSVTMTNCRVQDASVCHWEGLFVGMPSVTRTNADNFEWIGTFIGSSGASLVQNNAASSSVWYGSYIDMPNITQTAGTLTSTGIHIDGGIVTSGTSYAITTSSTAGHVGIGTTTPNESMLQIVDSSSPLTVQKTVGGYFMSMGFNSNNPFLTYYTGSSFTIGYGDNTGGAPTVSAILMDTGGSVVVGNTSISTGSLGVQAGSGVVAYFNREGNDGALINLMQGGNVEGVISVSGITVTYGGFTGSHYAWTDESIERGLLVSMTGDNRYFHGNPLSEILYSIAPSATANDSRILGSYLSLLEPSQPADDENPHQVMAVGNGDMWVVENGSGNVGVGDPLISSDTAGHAMKDPGTYAVSHVVARATEDIDWSTVTDTIEGKKRKKIIVTFELFDKNNIGAISTDGTFTLFGNAAALSPTSIASASSTAFSSFAMDFRGSAWDAASNTAITRNISVLNDITDASTYQLSFKNDLGQTLASLNQAGDFSIAGSLSVNGGFDYAEMFPAVPDIEAGDIVMVDPDNVNGYGVKKSSGAYENSLIGVISTKPGFITGKKEADTQPVALAGRVPVKVNDENGAINPGDPITSSSAPGVGMKATAAGRVIGIALEGSADRNDMILIFVNPSWWNGPMPIGATTAGSGLSITQDSLLDFKNSVFTNVGAILSTNGLWSITSDGYLVAQKIEAKEVSAEKFTVKVTGAPERVVGVGRFEGGKTAVLVQNPNVHPDSVIVVTFEGNPGSNWWVSEKQEGHFVLTLAQGAISETSFTYWIVPIDGVLDPPPVDPGEPPPSEEVTPPPDEEVTPPPDEEPPPPTDSGSGTPETPPPPTDSGSSTDETP